MVKAKPFAFLLIQLGILVRSKAMLYIALILFVYIGPPMSEIIVDDYTRRGLFNHILSHDGRALCAHEEMSAFFDIIQKHQLELSGERQLYCRLYDAGKWTNVTGDALVTCATIIMQTIISQVIRNRRPNNSWIKLASVLLVFYSLYHLYRGCILH